MKFTLTKIERTNLLSCFEKLYGKKSLDFELVTFMDDESLCEYWSKLFD